MRNIKIKQQKNFLEKIVSSSLGALIFVFAFYIYQNVNIVFNMIEYKNSVNKITELEKNILVVNDNIVDYKNNLSRNFATYDKLKKVSSDNFIVRKDTSSNLSLLYDIKQN